jgi:hypothetical protein
MEKPKVDVKIDLEKKEIEVIITAPEELIEDFVRELKEAEERGEVKIETLEVS